MNKKPVIGILGGIGSGKSSVARCFVTLGCALIDADRMAHDVLEKKDVIHNVVNVFGNDVVREDETINRQKLAEKAFSSSDSIEKLNAIIHPPVLEQAEELIGQYSVAPGIPGIVMDVPLLVETGWHHRCDVLVFVDCPEEVRRKHVLEKGQFGPEQIKKRENFQISLDKKRNMSQYIVKNNSDLSDLAEQVARIFSAVIKVRG